MTQFYSDPARESEKYALPDCEVFFAKRAEWAYSENGERCDVAIDDDMNEVPDQNVNEEGFYYWYCLPGCLPDSDPHGPFKTEQEAIDACREECAE